MTLRYHSPTRGVWTRCVAQTPEACPFKNTTHADRSTVATQHGGGVMQDSAARQVVVTPAVAGVYAVITPDGKARTYTAEGKLIVAKERAKHLQDVVLPSLKEGQSAKAGGRGLDAAIHERLSEQITFAQITLPPLTFNDRDDEVIVRRSPPKAVKPGAPVVTAQPVLKQSAKVPVRTQAQEQAAQTARRRRMLRNGHRAIRAFRAYDAALSKATGVGGSASGKGGDWLEGSFDWFLDLFDLSDAWDKA